MNKQFLVAWSALLAISISGCTAIAVVGDALECMSGIDCTTDLTDDAINGTNNASKNTTSKYIRGAQINEYRKQSTKSNTNYAHQYAQSNSNSNSSDINTNSEISLKNFSKKSVGVAPHQQLCVEIPQAPL